MGKKTSELTGIALDWAVYKAGHGEAELHYFVSDPFNKDPWLLLKGLCEMPLHGYTPTAEWHQGGPIIEREMVCLIPPRAGIELWEAYHPDFPQEEHYGPTPLIAAMRCYVASKLGDEVELPEELK